MSTEIHSVDDRLPKKGEKIIFRSWRGQSYRGWTDQVVYVASVDPRESLGYKVSVSKRADTNDGDKYVTHYSLVDEVVGDSEDALVSPEVAQKLTDLVLEAAKKRGYCSETQNILSDLGLPTEATKYQTVKFVLPKGDDPKVIVLLNGEPVEFEVVEDKS